MASSVKLKFQIRDDALKALQKLKGNLQKRFLTKALNEATKPMLLDARRIDRRVTRHLARSMTRKTKVYLSKGYGYVAVGPKTRNKQAFTIKPNEVFRQVPKGARPGRTIKIRKPTPEQLKVMRLPSKYMHLVEGGTKKHRKPRRAFRSLERIKQAQEARVQATFTRRLDDELKAAGVA